MKHFAKQKKTKNDQYFTLMSDIEGELNHYDDKFAGKTVLCPCDDGSSQFFQYFRTNFERLKLYKLYSTGIAGEAFEFDGNHITQWSINGDFRSEEVHDIIAVSDIIVTNPPFSLFREFFSTIKGKDYLIVGPKTAVSYKNVFPEIQSGRCKLGYTHPNKFATPTGEVADLSGLCRWFTSLEVKRKLCQAQNLCRMANYLEFDYYPAINIDQCSLIPHDYEGLMGVPITYLDKMDFNEFVIVDLIARYAVIDHQFDTKGHQLTEVNGRPKFSRLIIKKII